jgi:TPP-dependent indolepyruvate ferredoxin oxidoreductase alpha subunit
LLDALSIVHVPGLNEELAATAVMGSQVASTFPKQKFDGVLGVWYGKAPGVDRAGDALRHAAYAGTSRTGGVLALTGDDPACKSSTLPSSSEWTLTDLHMPILHPGNVQEILDLALHGVALSRTSGLWCAVKVVTAVADGSSNIEVGPDRIVPVIPELIWNGAPYVPKATGRVGPPDSTQIENEIYEARYELARMYGAENNLNRVTHETPNPWLGIAAPGRNYHEVLEALHVLGLHPADFRRYGIRLFQINMLHPLDRETLRRFADGLEEILVVEEKRPFVEMYMRDALYGRPAPRIIGKRVRRCPCSFPPPVPSTRSARRSASATTRRTHRPLATRAGEPSRLVAHATTDRGAAQPHAVLLFGVSTFDRRPSTGGRDGRSRHRVPRHGAVHGRQARRQHHRHHADGWRGRAVDRHRALRRGRPLHPEHR